MKLPPDRFWLALFETVLAVLAAFALAMIVYSVKQLFF
jgi:hypothetical protein